MKQRTRPAITALSLFFATGAVLALLSAFSLAIPGTSIDSMWRLNPRGRAGFSQIGPWAAPIMLVVSAACATAALGLWRGTRWGYIAALTLLSVNLIGDALNAILGSEPRALVGIPIAEMLIAYLLMPGTRQYFARDRAEPPET